MRDINTRYTSQFTTILTDVAILKIQFWSNTVIIDEQERGLKDDQVKN